MQAMELCLGTVQFGLDYGVLGQKKPSLDYSVNCLDYATQNGIAAIDTAEAYGTAQEVVGAFLAKRTVPREQLFISSKFLPNALDDCPPQDYVHIIQKHLTDTLKTLHTEYLDAYLFHSARYIYREELLAALAEMKKDGLVRKTGVSVYEPAEALAGFASNHVDFMQLPYSVFDHRMKQGGVLDSPLQGNCELHSRSAFIQGLILLDEADIPPYLSEATPIIQKISRIAKETGYSRVALAIAYVKRESAISHLVFGVDSLQQLQQDILLFQQDIPENVLCALDREFAGIRAEIVMPSLWKK